MAAPNKAAVRSVPSASFSPARRHAGTSPSSCPSLCFPSRSPCSQFSLSLGRQRDATSQALRASAACCCSGLGCCAALGDARAAPGVARSSLCRSSAYSASASSPPPSGLSAESPCAARTVVHVDMDCFYAQVETLRDPSVAGKPLAVRQKQLIVTTNLVARCPPWKLRKGIYLPEAIRRCPCLVVKNGEDLSKYRDVSDRILNAIQEKAFLLALENSPPSSRSPSSSAGDEPDAPAVEALPSRASAPGAASRPRAPSLTSQPSSSSRSSASSSSCNPSSSSLTSCFSSCFSSSCSSSSPSHFCSLSSCALSSCSSSYSSSPYSSCSSSLCSSSSCSSVACSLPPSSSAAGLLSHRSSRPPREDVARYGSFPACASRASGPSASPTSFVLSAEARPASRRRSSSRKGASSVCACHCRSLSRQASRAVVRAMLRQPLAVQRLGLDDFFIDVTALASAGARALREFLASRLADARDENEKGAGSDAPATPSGQEANAFVRRERCAAREASSCHPAARAAAASESGREESRAETRAEEQGEGEAKSLSLALTGTPQDRRELLDCSVWSPREECPPRLAAGRGREDFFFPEGAFRCSRCAFVAVAEEGEPPRPSGQTEGAEASCALVFLAFAPSVYPQKADEAAGGGGGGGGGAAAGVEGGSAEKKDFGVLCDASQQALYCLASCEEEEEARGARRLSGERGSVPAGDGLSRKRLRREDVAAEGESALAASEAGGTERASRRGDAHGECEEPARDADLSRREVGKQRAPDGGGDASVGRLCPCLLPLAIASHLAQAVRSYIHTRIGLTSTAGIGTNKSLAKLVGAYNKPSHQTLLLPQQRREFLAPLSLQKLPGFGWTLLRLLHRARIRTCADLLAAPLARLVGLLEAANFHFAPAAFLAKTQLVDGRLPRGVWGEGADAEKRRSTRERDAPLGRAKAAQGDDGALLASEASPTPSACVPSLSSGEASPTAAAPSPFLLSALCLRAFCLGDEGEPVVTTLAPKSLSAEDSYVARGVRTPERFVLEAQKLVARLLKRHADHEQKFEQVATSFKLHIRQKDFNGEGRQMTLPSSFWDPCVAATQASAPPSPSASAASFLSSSAAASSSSSATSASSPLSCPSFCASSDLVSLLCDAHRPLFSQVEAQLPSEVLRLLQRLLPAYGDATTGHKPARAELSHQASSRFPYSPASSSFSTLSSLSSDSCLEEQCVVGAAVPSRDSAGALSARLPVSSPPSTCPGDDASARVPLTRGTGAETRPPAEGCQAFLLLHYALLLFLRFDFPLALSSRAVQPDACDSWEAPEAEELRERAGPAPPFELHKISVGFSSFQGKRERERERRKEVERARELTRRPLDAFLRGAMRRRELRLKLEESREEQRPGPTTGARDGRQQAPPEVDRDVECIDLVTDEEETEGEEDLPQGGGNERGRLCEGQPAKAELAAAEQRESLLQAAQEASFSFSQSTARSVTSGDTAKLDSASERGGGDSEGSEAICESESTENAAEESLIGRGRRGEAWRERETQEAVADGSDASGVEAGRARREREGGREERDWRLVSEKQAGSREVISLSEDSALSEQETTSIGNERALLSPVFSTTCFVSSFVSSPSSRGSSSRSLSPERSLAFSPPSSLSCAAPAAAGALCGAPASFSSSPSASSPSTEFSSSHAASEAPDAPQGAAARNEPKV
ncbi:hypothetical protein BESB_070960 [Besnoitia besnoiti]|uniref:UmuC domain-containing protein n=1 Tax=Besnoitia besnoiti TaxID=94643 RepID=A0A2A9M9Q9_BESBE|nr:uncharacterized protein BESB_070960 [Besnoitia besnoiti]PFH33944.1 hypothetical protein BESB_070960 [Besnoitia besnoiti]